MQWESQRLSYLLPKFNVDRSPTLRDRLHQIATPWKNREVVELLISQLRICGQMQDDGRHQNFQFLDRCNSTAYCWISLEFGIDVDHVTWDKADVQDQTVKSQVLARNMLRSSSDDGECSCFGWFFSSVSALAIQIPAVGGGRHYYGMADKNLRRFTAYQLYGGLQLHLQCSMVGPQSVPWVHSWIYIALVCKL